MSIACLIEAPTPATTRPSVHRPAGHPRLHTVAITVSLERITVIQATAETWYHLYNQMHRQDVLLEGSLLKASMVLSGKACPEQASVDEVAEETVSLARELVPAAVPGIVFLSGGQSPVRATEHLNAMNELGEQPWQLGFSYARALQGPVMQIWRGDRANVEAAQKALYQRAKLNSEAMLGRYSSGMEQAA